jgi:hypothetical protein
MSEPMGHVLSEELLEATGAIDPNQITEWARQAKLMETQWCELLLALRLARSVLRTAPWSAGAAEAIEAADKALEAAMGTRYEW